MTYQNIGFWIGQANDTSGGTHPTGWTNGQRYSETAAEWMAMYNAMVAERDAWITNYNNMVADRNYWKTTVAHDDPNVWTNRYNAGYAAGVPAGQQAVYNGLNNPDGLQSVGISQNAWSQTTTLTFNRTGHHMIAIVAEMNVRPLFGNASVTGHCTGVSGYAKTLYPSNNDNSGGEQEHIMWAVALDLDVGAGQTLGIYFDSWATDMVNVGGGIYAHFVPNASYHN